MKRSTLLFSLLTAANAHAHSDAAPTVGTSINAAISATWRDEGTLQELGYWQIPGVLMGGEAYPVEQGTSLDEASLTLHHRAVSGTYGLLQISSHDNGGEAEVHHAYAGYSRQLNTLTLSGEAGRMAANISPGNGEHASSRLFSETPLALDAFLGRQLNDEGLRATLHWHGWRLGVESWRGSAFPATPGEQGGSVDVYLHHQGRWSDLHWNTGLWYLQADADTRNDNRYESGHSHGSSTTVTVPELWFDGSTDIHGTFLRLDWQATPAVKLSLHTEWLQQQVDGTLRDSTRNADYESDADAGWIETAVHIRNHTVATRWEQLTTDNHLTGAAASIIASTAGVYNDENPARLALLYRYRISPALAVRIEWTQDQLQPDETERTAVGIVWTDTLWSN